MKRTVAVLLLFMFLLSSIPVFSEPVFFPNGIQWGMSPTEVYTLAGDDLSGEMLLSTHVTGLSHAEEFDGYAAGAAYLFADGSLFAKEYTFYGNADYDSVYAKLYDDLSSVYGEPRALPVQSVTDLFSLIYFTDINAARFSRGAAWETPDGTKLWLFMDSGHYPCVIYTDPAFDFS